MVRTTTSKTSLKQADSLLLLPGEPGFNEILALPPPSNNRNASYVVRSNGLLIEAVDESELEEYFDSGEYDERLEQIDIEEAESDILYLPSSVSIR